MMRVAGQALAAAGIGAGLGAGGLALVQHLAEQGVPEAAPLQMPKPSSTPTVSNGLDWFERNKAIPGNSFVLPHHETQHEAGMFGWQYPFFRQDLVDAGVLPAKAPAGNPGTIYLPPGVTVLDAIRSGLIR